MRRREAAEDDSRGLARLWRQLIVQADADDVVADFAINGNAATQVWSRVGDGYGAKSM